MRPIVKILGTGLTVASLLGCAGQGDLGRTKPNEFSFVGGLGDQLAVLINPDLTNGLPLTDEEQQLRTLAGNIDGHVDTSSTNLLERFSILKTEDVGDKAYYRFLLQAHSESGVGLLNTFGNDAMRDVTMADQFASLSIAVTGADAQRLSLVRGAMAANSAVFSDAVDVVLRVEGNGNVIDQTVDLLDQRLVEYRVALEQAAFDIPERDLIATIEEVLNMLEGSIDGIREDAARHRAVRGELFGRRSSELPV